MALKIEGNQSLLISAYKLYKMLNYQDRLL